MVLERVDEATFKIGAQLHKHQNCSRVHMVNLQHGLHSSMSLRYGARRIILTVGPQNRCHMQCNLQELRCMCCHMTLIG